MQTKQGGNLKCFLLFFYVGGFPYFCGMKRGEGVCSEEYKGGGCRFCTTATLLPFNYYHTKLDN